MTIGLMKSGIPSFQLAALQIGFLQKMQITNDVKRNLTTLPDTLMLAYDEIYNGVLAQKGSAPRIALNTFRWIQCSKEPLSSQCLLDAVTVEVNSSGEFSHGAPATVQQLLTICQNLMVFDNTLATFRFAHLSVDENLETKLSRPDSHIEVSKVCLSLLCTHSAWDAYDQNITTQEGTHGNRHLLLYSAAFWPWDFGHCGDFNRCLLVGSLWYRLMSDHCYKRWLHYYRKCVIVCIWQTESYWRRLSAIHSTPNGFRSATSDTRSTPQSIHSKTNIHSTTNGIHPTTDGRLFCISIFGLYQALLDFFELGLGAQVEMSEKQISIVHAAKFGEIDIVQFLIDRGANMSVTGIRGWLPLHQATTEGELAVVQLFIDRGANLSSANECGWTPLHLASVGGHQAVARLLIAAGANPSTADNYGMTPLHYACREGHQAVALLLIDGGATITQPDDDGRTPLHYSASRGSVEICLMLLGVVLLYPLLIVRDRPHWTSPTLTTRMRLPGF